MLHKHRWGTISKRFNPPRRSSAKAKWYDDEGYEQVLRLLYGFTVVTQQCNVDGCGKARSYTVAGQA